MAAVLDETVAPTQDDSDLARDSSRKLSGFAGKKLTVKIPANGHAGETVVLPASAVRLLVRILSEMAEGNAVTLIPIHAELTTQEAADLLNVSRPFLIGLLEAGKIPFHRVGKHRRIRFSDLIAYKKVSDAERKAALEQLAADAQENGMGY